MCYVTFVARHLSGPFKIKMITLCQRPSKISNTVCKHHHYVLYENGSERKQGCWPFMFCLGKFIASYQFAFLFSKQLLSAKFGLFVEMKEQTVSVSLHSDYYGQASGLCGNCDKNNTNECIGNVSAFVYLPCLLC